ncbi:MAG: hypothetical protein WC955_10420 [Elusimicrobiota bacterium]
MKYLYTALIWGLTIISALLFQKVEYYKFPSLRSLTYSEVSRNDIIDIAGTVMGMRKMASNFAWVQLLQYYGSAEIECEEEEMHKCEHHAGIDFGSGKYPKFTKLSLRVIKLDPYFHYAYLYSAGALAWNLERPDDALEILQTGVKYNPKYWKFRLYIAGIVYKKIKDYGKMVNVLEEAVTYPDCPNMVKSILANIYELQGRFADTLKLWLQIYDTNDLSYREKAIKKIDEMSAKLGLDKAN